MSEEARHAVHPPQSPIEVGVRGRCPRCGKGRLFDGYLATAERCEVCGLDYGFVDSADGPAVFIIMIVGFLVVGLALLAEVWWSPPLWLHLVLWTPLILVLTIGLLRPLKGVIVALQYRTKAAEGRLAP